MSNNGRCFISGEFRRVLEQRGIAQVLTAPYCPFSNGQVESAVRVVKEHYKRTPASSGADRLQNAVARSLLSSSTWESTVQSKRQPAKHRKSAEGEVPGKTPAAEDRT